MNVLVNVGNIVGEAIQEGDVEICHQVPVPNSDANTIVVQCISKNKRNAFLEKSSRKRVSCGGLGISSHGPVFINEHLCPTMKKLLGQAIARKRANNWKFVWVRNGSIFARKLEDSPVVGKGCAFELERIVKNTY